MNPNQTAKPKILVADDSLVVRSMLRRDLEAHGYQVIEAVDGEDAVIRVEAEHPDVVLLDVEMPRLDGHGAIVRIRELDGCADLPVVFLTGLATTDDVVKGLALGAHDYLSKPFEVSELVARVSAACRVKFLQDELRSRNAELEQISRVDVLTGLANRRHLIEHMHAASAGARRHGQPFSLLMIDVDHFKKVNDDLGHEAGDIVLREIAKRLAAGCRGEDLCGRWGGEEFLAIAPGTALEDAIALAERMRTLVADRHILVDDDRVVDVTVSIGVASGVVDGESLLRSADRSLYEAKETGRNCVVAGSS